MVFAGEQMISGHWTAALFLITAFVALALLGYVIARKRNARQLSSVRRQETGASSGP
jgi:VIT1/CCC1 family predicted Fe2+/Mn2+ transporter